MAGVHPQEPDQFVLVHQKSSVGARGPSLTYSISDYGLDWNGPLALSAEQLLDPHPTVSKPSASAISFLTEFLKDGPKPSNEIHDAADKRGISQNKLKLGRETLGIIVKPSGFGNAWYWSLSAKEVPDKEEEPKVTSLPIQAVIVEPVKQIVPAPVAALPVKKEVAREPARLVVRPRELANRFEKFIPNGEIIEEFENIKQMGDFA